MICRRIKAIAELIEKDERVADVGCDHGYLAYQLRTNGHEALICCLDNKKGPLLNAKGNLGGFEKIEYRLTDGLKGMDLEVDCVVLAGMGNHTVEHILSASEEYLKSVRKVIVQCNNNLPELRQWLTQQHYTIEDEITVYDRHYYFIFVLSHGQQQLTDFECRFGPCLLKKREALWLDYLAHEKEKISSIIDRMEPEHPDALALKKELDDIENLLKK